MISDQPVLLLVDDEPTNLRVLRTVLQEQYRLLFAKSGEEALQLVQKEQPDLILLDVMMPGLTGFDVCARLKANPATSAIPVIFVTALKDEMDETKGFEVGAVDYITKPISPAVVRARVKTHLSLVQAQELKQTRLQVIQRLGRAAEYKDNETGLHVMVIDDQEVVVGVYCVSVPILDRLGHAAGAISITGPSVKKPGTEVLHPVAVVIFSGLISSTLLDTFLTPAMFWLFGRKPAEALMDDRDAEAL